MSIYFLEVRVSREYCLSHPPNSLVLTLQGIALVCIELDEVRCSVVDEGLLATTLVVYTAMHSDSTVFIQKVYIPYWLFINYTASLAICTVWWFYIRIYIVHISLDYVLCKTSELHWV